MKCPECQDELVARPFQFKYSHQTIMMRECPLGHGVWFPDEFFKRFEVEILATSTLSQHYADGGARQGD